MSRETLSLDAVIELLSPESDEPFIALVTMTGSNLTAPLRFANNYTQRLSQTAEGIVYGVVSRGAEFVCVPFEMTLPDDDDSGSQQLNLQFIDLTGDIRAAARQLTTFANVKIELVLKSAPDVVEIELPEFIFGGFPYDGSSVTMPLTIEGYDTEPCSALGFTPGYFPGGFDS